MNADSCLDWLFAQGSRDGTSAVAPLLASVVRDMRGLSSDDPDDLEALGVAPSDHCPVLAVYRWKRSLPGAGRRGMGKGAAL